MGAKNGVILAPEVLFPVVDITNRKVMDGRWGNQNPKEVRGEKQFRGSLEVQEEELGQLADPKSSRVKIKPPKALKGG
ncbi:MAG: hypothetical protein IPK73_29860 [Candidatus Obscuribacter sp.]|nr:hypothetical protein [Candidatus Obscuribacter sp.]